MENNRKPLLKYEFVGGIYSILLMIFALLDIFFVFFTVHSIVSITEKLQPISNLMSELNIEFSKALESISGGSELLEYLFEMSLVEVMLSTILYLILGIWITVSTILLIKRYMKNRNTYFELYEDNIIGLGIAKQNSRQEKHIKKFDVNIKDIKYIFVNNGFLVFAAKDIEYRIMITSIDFNKKLKNTISKII